LYARMKLLLNMYTRETGFAFATVYGNILNASLKEGRSKVFDIVLKKLPL